MAFVIELRRGPVGEELVIRRHEADSEDMAAKLVEGLRDTYNQRDGVTWQYELTNAEGKLYGLGPGGMVYTIAVEPPVAV
jgi:hypothetical protein